MAYPSGYVATKLTASTSGESIADDGDLNFATRVVILTDDGATQTLPFVKSSLYLVSRTTLETNAVSVLPSVINIPTVWTTLDIAQTDNRNTGWRIRIHYTSEANSLTVSLGTDLSFVLATGETVEIIFSPFVPRGLVLGTKSGTLTPLPRYILTFTN